MAPLSQRAEEADHSASAVMDLSYLESVVPGIKEMQNRYSQKWQALKEQRNSASLMDQKLRDKGSELREWHGKQFQTLLWQQEVMTMVKEDVAAREARLVERPALLNTKEKDISSREENLEATLRNKDEELEALVQQRTKDLEDRHKAALDTLTLDSAAQLKRITDDLAAASIAKADLNQQVAKLTEELAGSAKETTALKEDAQKAEILLKEVQSQLSSKSQDLDTANGVITDMKAWLGTLESRIESADVREKQLMKDLYNARIHRKVAEDKLANQVGQRDLWIKNFVDITECLSV
jgi:chromosome segregation ATPase